MARVDLGKVNAALKSREKRRYQNVAPVPKELHELRRATHKLEAQTRQLRRQIEAEKERKKIARTGHK